MNTRTLSFLLMPLMLGALTSCVCMRNAGPHPLSPQEFIILDEDGNVRDFLMEPVTFSMSSREYVLGHVLAECDRRLTNRTVHISILSRDCRPTPTPRTTVTSSDDLRKIYADKNDPRARGPINTEFDWTRLSHHISFAAIPDQTMTDTFGDPSNLYFRIGPIELVSYMDPRRAYKVPVHLHDAFKKLPSSLYERGHCLAYDPKTKIVVVIDKHSSSAFQLIEALGCTRIPIKESTIA